MRCIFGRDDPATATQAGIARGMAVFVVVGLEVIDIDHQQSQAGAVAIGARPFLFQPLVEAAAVGKAR